jgi:hypothetical protein
MGEREMNTIKSTSAFNGSLAQPNTERRSFVWKVGAALSAIAASAVACTSKREADDLKTLKEQLEQMSNKLGMVEDVNAIRKLHHAYGYYLDKCIYEEVVKLFADDSEVHFNGGIYIGKDKGVRRLYIDNFSQNFTGKKNGPIYGFLLDHIQLQDIVDVAPDRKTAKARFRCFMQAGAHETSKSAEAARKQGRRPMQWWEGGIYENEYVKEGNIWKIKVLDYRAVWHADYETGWAHTRPNYVPPASKTYPENLLGPDKLMPKRVLWPDTDVVPFHYPNPVTGEQWKA